MLAFWMAAGAMAGTQEAWLTTAFDGVVVGTTTRRELERILGEPQKTARNADQDLIVTYGGGTMPGGARGTSRVFTLLQDGDEYVVVAAEVRDDDKISAKEIKAMFGKAEHIVDSVRYWCGSARNRDLYFVVPVEDGRVWSVGVVSARWLRESNQLYRICRS